MTNMIYYFTGTGNSLQIANDVASILGKTTVRKIAEYDGSEVVTDTLGIVFPVYMWGLPLILVDFIKQIKVSESTYIYAIANYGGLPGKALEQCQDLLKERGLHLSSGYLIQMPGNCILEYGASSDSAQQKLFKKEEKAVQYISTCVKERKVQKIEKSHLLIDRILTDKMYTKIQQFHTLDKNFVVSDECISCGKCAKSCPVHNIVMVEGKPQWQHHCERCVACIQGCPKNAIDYAGKKTQGRKRYWNPNV